MAEQEKLPKSFDIVQNFMFTSYVFDVLRRNRNSTMPLTIQKIQRKFSSNSNSVVQNYWYHCILTAETNRDANTYNTESNSVI